VKVRGRANEVVAALIAPSRLDETGVLQLVEDDLQEARRDGLGFCDLPDLDRGGPIPLRQLKDRPDSVLALLRYQWVNPDYSDEDC
jgi:hypothetical protein